MGAAERIAPRVQAPQAQAPVPQAGAPVPQAGAPQAQVPQSDAPREAAAPPVGLPAVGATPPPGPPGGGPHGHRGRAQAPMRTEPRPPIRLVLTILHLAFYGLIGFALIGTLLGVVAAAVALLFVLGAGLVVLVGNVYALFGIAWFENNRVSGLYRLGLPSLTWRRQEQPGFKGWLQSLGRQAIDGRMWRALANFAIASVFGAAVLGCFQWFARSFVTLFRGDPFPAILSLAGVMISAAAIVGFALLYRLVAIAIARAGAKEQRLAAQATASAQRATVSARQREGAVRAADVERTRIERDLHDGVQPRLVSVGMTLGLAQQKIDSDPEAAKQLVAEAHTSTKAAITELRQLARGIYASVLDDRGLDAALSAVAARSHIPVQLDVRLERRCSRDAEAAVYFAIAESLTNAAKHSRASEARVVVRIRENDTLWARVEDNGIGGARVVPGGGLDGVMNRVLAAGGSSTLDSPQGGPTALEVIVPCAS
ncbi:sensor histidine kinase [Leucobacter zeae]|nr:sensor histidine kinase [Leucobacter zeae]